MRILDSECLGLKLGCGNLLLNPTESWVSHSNMADDPSKCIRGCCAD